MIDRARGLIARLRSFWRGVRRRGEIEAEMTEEFRHHLELRTEDLMRRGVAPAEAARRARLEFGHVEGHKEDARASRGLRLFDEVRFSWLDVKLGVRMLVRYPGLTVVGGLAMAFAVFVGALTFQFVKQTADPTLPLPGGERIVGLRYWDLAENDPSFPLPEDLRGWLEELGTVEDLGGFRTVERNLAAAAEAGEPARVALMSPAGFRVAGIPPLLGRFLVDADEDPDASAVVVLGHHAWRTRLAGDPGVIGRTVRLGDEMATVVGVMPAGFGFPRDHELWAPLRLADSGDGAASAAPLRVFGRLVPGVGLEEAAAELATVAARAAPERHATLRSQVLPYARSLASLDFGLLGRLIMFQVNAVAALFLILVCANVALLMFARAATREREILLRNALGASRGRIIAQLFVEALVLGALAAGLGLAAAAPAWRWLTDRMSQLGDSLPFWFDTGLLPTTLIYALLLTLLGAVVAGVVPALKVTGRGMQARLRQAGAGAGGLRLGGIWTGIVVTQIAATVVFTGLAYVVVRQAVRSATVEVFFPAEQYLGARVELERDPARPGSDTTESAFLGRYATMVRALEGRLAGDPAVAGVTLAQRLPMKSHGLSSVELDDGGAASPDAEIPRHTVASGAVDLDFFHVLQTPVLAGRGFDSRDLGGARTVVVNASFVVEVMGGRSAVGQRIRYVSRTGDDEPGPWHEVVGVVQDLVADRTRSLDLEDPARARVYHPLDLARAGVYPLHIVAHAPGAPGALAPTLYRAAEAVSPALLVHEIQTLDRADSELAMIWRLWANLVLLVSAVALFLSLAGIYAVMSFTVSRSTREIGVRVAMGESARRVVKDIFRAPLTQVATGIAIGCVVVGLLVWRITSGRVTATDGLLLLAYTLCMTLVCALACITPTLRALRVQPAEALTAEE